MRKYKGVKEMIAGLSNNTKFIKDTYEFMDKKFMPIEILITKEDRGYIATFNTCGGGTQAPTLNKLCDNIKEVLWLIEEERKDWNKKENKRILKNRSKNRGK